MSEKTADTQQAAAPEQQEEQLAPAPAPECENLSSGEVETEAAVVAVEQGDSKVEVAPAASSDAGAAVDQSVNTSVEIESSAPGLEAKVDDDSCGDNPAAEDDAGDNASEERSHDGGDAENRWQLDPGSFSLEIRASPEQKCTPNSSSQILKYYKAQNGLISAYHELQARFSRDMDLASVDSGAEEKMGLAAEGTGESITRGGQKLTPCCWCCTCCQCCYCTLVGRAMLLSFVANVLLFIIKMIAAITTGSLAVIASTVDSVLDLLAGLVIYCTSRMARNHDSINYPQGKTRLEPLGVIVFTCIMSVSMMGLVQQSATTIVDRLTGKVQETAKLDWLAVSFLTFTVVLKSFLFVYCSYVARAGRSPSISAYAEDHRNDVITNIAAIFGGGIATLYSAHFWWTDSTCAILLCIYVIYSWSQTAREQIRQLTGISAPPDFLNQLTFIAYNHHPDIVKVDTVRAYHFGTRLLAEVDVVLPEEMPLRTAHDIGEALQMKLEQLEEVERAFVHLDWEWDHKPEHRHAHSE